MDPSLSSFWFDLQTKTYKPINFFDFSEDTTQKLLLKKIEIVEKALISLNDRFSLDDFS